MELTQSQLMDVLPGYATVQDKNFTIIEANRRFRERFGDVVGRKCYHVYKQRPEKCLSCPVEWTFRSGKPQRSEEEIATPGGTGMAVVVNTEPIRDESGEIVAVIELATDITDIRAMDRQIAESQQRYRRLFNEAPCYVSIQDRDLNIVDANRRFREDFGNALGSKCHKVYKHRDKICVECPVQRTFEDGEVHQSEEVVTAGDGRKVNVMVYTAPLRDADGTINRVMEMSANITEVRQLQDKLTSIGMLISSISHSVKGLLTGMDGGIYLVNTGLKKDKRERIEEGWAMVTRNVDRIRRMMVDILYYAKDREPNWADISAPKAAQEVLNVIDVRAKRNNIELRNEIDADCGEFEADLKVIRSLLVNLAENSIDACRMDERKDSHFVSVGAKGNADSVEFSIEDNGIGMDQETREKAFTLFFSSKGSEGTGLGLFISNKIAQTHGGTIELTSEVDRGTRFVVNIPRKRTKEMTESAQILESEKFDEQRPQDSPDR